MRGKSAALGCGGPTKTVCLVVLICLAWAALAGAAENKQKCIAVGMATIHGSYTDIARDKAIDNALRNVVERVAGVMVTGSTEVENFQLKMDRILSESKGFIENYRILSEKKDGSNYEVTIEAEVGTGKLEERLKAVELVLDRKARPRLMIVFGETAQKDAIAEAAMSKFFLGKGFKLVDASVVKRKRGELNAAVCADDDQALSKLVRNFGAEIVIAGSVEAVSNSFTVEGIEMFTNKVNVCLKVINGDTGDLITTGSESNSKPGPKGDIGGITEEAVVKLARKLLDETLECWSSELANTTSVKLAVSGLDNYEDLLDFKEQLPLVLKGFKALFQRAYVQGAVELDVEIKGDIQGVADDLSVITQKGRKLKILAITQNMISATFLP